MTKNDIINNITNTTGIAKKDVNAVVEAFITEMKNSMINKEDIFLRGLGTFYIKHCATKTARNIKENTTIIVDARDVPAFRPSKLLLKEMK